MVAPQSIPHRTINLRFWWNWWYRMWKDRLTKLLENEEDCPTKPVEEEQISDSLRFVSENKRRKTKTRLDTKITMISDGKNKDSPLTLNHHCHWYRSNVRRRKRVTSKKKLGKTTCVFYLFGFCFFCFYFFFLFIKI